MDLLNVKLFPEKVLRQKCSPIKEVTPRETELLNRMHWTMQQAGGIGLAAPQVGITERFFVADIGDDRVVKLINPKVMNSSGWDKLEEGCLSLPKTLVEVERPYEVTVTGLDEQGRQREWRAKGLLARVMLHEIDHLDGKLIIDYLDFYNRIKFNLSYRTG